MLVFPKGVRNVQDTGAVLSCPELLHLPRGGLSSPDMVAMMMVTG
jgi:hypothetical protein